MSKYTVPEYNVSTGIDPLLSEIVTQVPIFVPFLLLFIYSVIFVAGYRKQTLDRGVGDAPLWATISGIITSIVALLLSTRAGLIDVFTLVVPIVITILSGIWLFSSKDK